ncbi:hypothetical protein BGW80DRAFT_1458110 [Lactifluus volemus]|nr:hypothetical protein BGW80DRAFT_1458110 [Lactifluus volemus]
MSPAGTVQDNKAKRQEWLKSRFRHLGSIFVPSEGNVLADILLSRGVNGGSPIKKRASCKSAVTPKSRAPAASKAAAKSKTSRTGTSKRNTKICRHTT